MKKSPKFLDSFGLFNFFVFVVNFPLKSESLLECLGKIFNPLRDLNVGKVPKDPRIPNGFLFSDREFEVFVESEGPRSS